MFKRINLALDLGTVNTLFYATSKGIVFNEPSVVAINTETNQLVASGYEAKKMIGRTASNIKVIHPLQDGVISDFEATELMIKAFLAKINIVTFNKPTIIACVPAAVNKIEKKAIIEILFISGIKKIYLIAEPVAAAIGSEIPILQPLGNMVIDIGGGTSEIAIMSYGNLVLYESFQIAGNELDVAIIQYIKRKHSILLGSKTCEDLKIKLGYTYIENTKEAEADTHVVYGRDLVTGFPRTVTITGIDIYNAISPILKTIIDAVRDVLDKCPPELSGDIYTQGIYLAGGGALLKNIDKLLTKELSVSVRIVKNPLHAIINGASICIENLDKYKAILQAV